MNRSPGADLRPSGLALRWAALCFVATFVLYAALIPRVLLYSNPPTGDQAYYLIETISLVQDHDFNLANNYAQHDEDKFYSLAPHPPGFVGISAPYPLPPQLSRSTARPTDEWYGYHLPGLPLVLAPAWIVGGWFSLWWPATVVWMCAIGALVATNIFLLAHETAGRFRVSVPVWLGLACASPLMTYTYLIFTELPTGLLVVYVFRRLELGWASNPRWRLLLLGACIAFIPWLAWRCTLISASLVLLALIQWWRARLSGAAGWRSLVWLLTPGVLSAIALVTFNEYLFGRPIPTLTVPELGDADPFHFPWTGWAGFAETVTDALALLFDRQMGLITYTPVLLLAIVGAIGLWRSKNPGDRRLLGALALIILPYFGMLAAYHFWNGIWNPPARFQTTLVPLLAAPLAVSLRSATRVFRLVYMFLAAVGVLLALAMLADARRLWPTSPVFGWLAAGENLPVHLDVRGMLPAFSPVDEIGLPGSTAAVLLVSFAIVGVCSHFLQPGPVVPPSRQTALSWLGAAGVLAASWYVTNAEYLKPRTLLYELQRWSLPPELDETRGIAYLDDRIYITGFRSGSLIAFDTSTATSSYLLRPQPTLAVSERSERPSDVQVGPDGLLYVLNNGAGSRALLVLSPGGEVVRQLPLEGTSPTTMGLSISADGGLRVGDMVGGRILTYTSTGGRPTGSWGGLTGGFNNVSGLAMAADGSVYAAEFSAHRIQHLAADGHALGTFELDCEPQYVALSGEWLDMTCGAGLLSINTRAGYLQRTRIVEGNTHFDHPRGLAYGPDNTLFVVDDHTLLQFTIEH